MRCDRSLTPSHGSNQGASRASKVFRCDVPRWSSDLSPGIEHFLSGTAPAQITQSWVTRSRDLRYLLCQKRRVKHAQRYSFTSMVSAVL